MQSLEAGLRTVRALGAEVIILLFCVGILMEVGQTKGPTFDSIGPDVIPQTLAVMVILLTSVQLVVNAVGLLSPDSGGSVGGVDSSKLKSFAFFILATTTFLLALRFWVAPMVFLTPVFILIATLIFSNNLKRRTIITGTAIGVALGVIQYIIFTNFLHVDLYVTL